MGPRRGRAVTTRAGRRRWLRTGALSAVSGALAGCEGWREDLRRAARDPAPVGSRGWASRAIERLDRWVDGPITGGFVDGPQRRGHLLREALLAPGASGDTHRVKVAIVGGGIAGLSAARALRRAGVDDLRVFELADSAGGNSLGGQCAGHACAWGAHYLPLPDQDAASLRELLAEFGLLRAERGREVWDERAICHAPQERLLQDGQWHSGLLPKVAPASADAREYARFARVIETRRASALFHLPADIGLASGALATLDRISFADWLDENDLRGASLRWYLDYCCRDDYGARPDQVSAWAGLHYFACRHGTGLADDADTRPDSGDERAGDVLTWPQGNQWLVDRLATPLGERLVTGALVRHVRVDPAGHDAGCEIESWRASDEPRAPPRVERWRADFVVMSTPLHVAVRVLDPVPPALAALAPSLRYASWMVANLHLPEPPSERPGVPRAWDNVIHGDRDSLGYIDAGHQSLAATRRSTLFTYYRAVGPSPRDRRALLGANWREAVDGILTALAPAHEDIRDKVRRVDIMRWGHAMLVPAPGLRANPALVALRRPHGRVFFAHSDLAGYSVFEEAFAQGDRAGRAIARLLADRG